jgi:hypothetical protein
MKVFFLELLFQGSFMSFDFEIQVSREIFGVPRPRYRNLSASNGFSGKPISEQFPATVTV